MSEVVRGERGSGGGTAGVAVVNEEGSVCPLCRWSYDRHESDPVRGTGEVRYWCPSGMSVWTAAGAEAGEVSSADGNVLAAAAEMPDDVRYFKHGWDSGYPTGWRAAERWHGVEAADAAVVSEGCGVEESAV